MRIGLACGGPPPRAVLDLLAAAGLPAASLREARAPALIAGEAVSWLLAGGHDVLRACDRGGLDLAVVGKDTLLEARRAVSELLDLRCCRDELVLAVAFAAPPRRRLRVATCYPETARRYFAATGRQPELLVMEQPAVAPALGLADGVLDLASRLSGVPGAAGLEVKETLAACSARLVAGRASRALLGERLAEVVDRLRTARGER